MTFAFVAVKTTTTVSTVTTTTTGPAITTEEVKTTTVVTPLGEETTIVATSLPMVSTTPGEGFLLRICVFLLSIVEHRVLALGEVA